MIPASTLPSTVPAGLRLPRVRISFARPVRRAPRMGALAVQSGTLALTPGEQFSVTVTLTQTGTTTAYWALTASVVDGTGAVVGPMMAQGGAVAAYGSGSGNVTFTSPALSTAGTYGVQATLRVYADSARTQEVGGSPEVQTAPAIVEVAAPQSGTTSTTSTSTSASSGGTAGASFSLMRVTPTSVPVGGTLTAVFTVYASSSAWWRLQLYVRDSRTGHNVASFPPATLRGTQSMQWTSGPIGSRAYPGNGLALVGTLTTGSTSALTGQVSVASISTGDVASVLAQTSSGTGTATQSPTCQALWNQFNSLYQQQLQLRLQAAALYPAGNLPTALNDQITNLGSEMDQIEVQYGQNGCTLRLP